MVAPISGPFDSQSLASFAGAGSYWIKKSKYKQARPYTLPAPFYSSLKRCITAYGPRIKTNYFSNADASYGWNSNRIHAVTLAEGGYGAFPAKQSLMDLCDTVARQKFLHHMHEGVQNASLGTTLGEYRSSRDAAVKRLSQLMLVAHSVRSRNLDLLFKVLSLSGVKTNQVRSEWRFRSRQFADNFLEVSFGWIPLVSDLQQAIRVLEAPIANGRVRAHHKAVTRDVWSGSTNRFTNYATAYADESVDHLMSLRTSVQGEIKVTNPNLYLMKRLGLINPAVTLWELGSFTFIVDRFLTIKEFFAQSSDFAGIELINANYSRKLVSVLNYTNAYRPKKDNSWPADYPGKDFNRVRTIGISFQRLLGVPTSSIVFKNQLPLDLFTAGWVSALLVQKGITPSRITQAESTGAAKVALGILAKNPSRREARSWEQLQHLL
ncbi:MAG: maturation protein [Sanya fiers-like virus 17]|nr:MAG: maturation protein [Sanya fiers-like virus 17]